MHKKGYNALDYYNANKELKQVIDMIQSGYFSKGNPDTFKDVTDNLLYHDRFLTLADFEATWPPRTRCPPPTPTKLCGPRWRFTTSQAAASLAQTGLFPSTHARSGEWSPRTPSCLTHTPPRTTLQTFKRRSLIHTQPRTTLQTFKRRFLSHTQPRTTLQTFKRRSLTHTQPRTTLLTFERRFLTHTQPRTTLQTFKRRSLIHTQPKDDSPDI